MFILIDTWNGEGYSYQNGNEIEVSKTLDGLMHSFNNHAVDVTKNYPSCRIDRNENVISFSDNDDSHGTYQILEFNPDIHHVARIAINTNEVTFMSLQEANADWDVKSSACEDYDLESRFIECAYEDDISYQYRVIYQADLKAWEFIEANHPRYFTSDLVAEVDDIIKAVIDSTSDAMLENVKFEKVSRLMGITEQLVTEARMAYEEAVKGAAREAVNEEAKDLVPSQDDIENAVTTLLKAGYSVAMLKCLKKNN